MFCNKCGKLVPEGQECPYCAAQEELMREMDEAFAPTTPLGYVSAPPIQQSMNAAAQRPSAYAPTQLQAPVAVAPVKKGKAGLIIGIVVALAIVTAVAAGAVAYLSSDGETTQEQAQILDKAALTDYYAQLVMAHNRLNGFVTSTYSADVDPDKGVSSNDRETHRKNLSAINDEALQSLKAEDGSWVFGAENIAVEEDMKDVRSQLVSIADDLDRRFALIDRVYEKSAGYEPGSAAIAAAGNAIVSEYNELRTNNIEALESLKEMLEQ